VSDVLNAAGIQSKLVIVTDNNDIDREVAQFKPTHVFIEALWVVPDKFRVLKALHPEVTWVVRIHSQIPFLALESIAMEWVKQYVAEGVVVAANSIEAGVDLETVVDSPLITYLPNYYPTDGFKAPKKFKGKTINIGCFGAVRPFKNQLLQAIAAIQYSDSHDLTLTFHINATRIEKGEGVLQNLRALFSGTRHTLSEDVWMTHCDFLAFLRNQIDLSMMVSFTETFSIVSADAVSQGVPIVVSSQVYWADKHSFVSTTAQSDMVQGIAAAIAKPKFTDRNQKNLATFSKQARKVWLEYLAA